ncbi:TonB-dependent siderophore receptor [Bordetella sp. 02P26C-1]|uniref:TonB-dependent siderophore receptor n=1 Tax=Bordetella sp. 02P26C-1 TaxID=2683195 RepID=UPI003FA4C00C
MPALLVGLPALGSPLVHAQTVATDTTSSSDVAQMPSVTVQAEPLESTLQHLELPVDMGALGSRSAIETPFSSTVVTAQHIESRQINKLGDVFALDASVSDNSAANGAWSSYLTVRGLALDWRNSYRIDGKPFVSYVTTLPYEQMERIDLLKGASGFMYGFGAPGGMLNYVTKKPPSEPVRSFTLGYTSKSLWRESVDLGARVGEDERFGYRLNATHEEGKTYNDGSLYRDSVSLALDARLTDKLTWDFQSIYQDRNAIGMDATITTSGMSGTSLPSPVRADNHNLQGEGLYADNAFRFYSTGLKYQLNDQWSLRSHYTYNTTRTRRNESVLALTDSSGNYDDYRSDYGEAHSYNQWETAAEGRFDTGPLKHQVVFGASWQKQKTDLSANSIYQLEGTGNLYEPNPNTYYSVGQLSLYRSADITQKAIFASDTVDLTHGWSVLAGLRYTDYEQRSFLPSGDEAAPTYKKNGVLTPTVALMFNFTPQTMAYASYIESLEPGSVVGNTYENRGALLSPLKSKQYELGIKTEREDWSATAALFRIERKSEYGRELESGGRELVQDGKSIYQGLELATAARIARQWHAGASIMLLDTEYKRGADHTGNRVAGAPRFIAAAQLAYDVPQVPGLRLRADAKYTGNVMLDASNQIEVDNYTIFNIGATYDTRIYGYNTTLRAAINNLTDKRYWLYQSENYIKAGDPRTFSLSASVAF